MSIFHLQGLPNKYLGINMVKSANLGFPRIGHNRELKKSVESYWKGNISQSELQAKASEIRQNNWKIQSDSKIDYIPSNDFSFYDQILDTICLVGSIPETYQNTNQNVSLDTYFSMARGLQKDGIDVPAMEMTKWYDTNYHYIVPEFTKDQNFKISSSKIFDEYLEAKELGYETRPVLVGPVTLLSIGKTKGESFNKFNLLNKLVTCYQEIITRLTTVGVKDIQIDEPALVTDLDDDIRACYKSAYDIIGACCAESNVNLHITTYFAAVEENLKTFLNIPAKSHHIDLVRATEQLDLVLENFPAEGSLSLGLINGRNIWLNNLEESLKLANKAIAKLGADKVIIAPSCSLLHSPVDLAGESKIDPEIKEWLAFAVQKLQEVSCLKDILTGSNEADNEFYQQNKAAIERRRTSAKVNNAAVKKRVESLSEADYDRSSPYELRANKQKSIFNLPLYPTTTIGSFPQTTNVRKHRAALKKGDISQEEYDEFIANETNSCIERQKKLDIDVLVHGEFERNDMVEYFGEQLDGFAFTKNGWVQSYGSRCVKPPIIFGDVSRPNSMTVRWSKYAQEQTSKPVKGMLTGPVTILQWSFVRDDQPRETTCKQIGFAIQDEVKDLETNGIGIIQIDEPAIREGLPIHRAQWQAYLKWAVDSFKLSQATANDETQIHTHMCYSEFNDIINSIAAMDADVISIETSRSQMELLDAFVDFNYPNEIGPGVYDIHSPRVPTRNEMKDLLIKALKVLPAEKVWVNPDCGLKTRGWPEVELALKEMVLATKELRNEAAAKQQA